MPGDKIDSLERFWQSVLDFLSLLMIPDWGSVIALLPILLVLGVLGPLLSLLALVWFIYVVRRPRSRVRFAEGPRPAALGAGGAPVFPTGEPHCARDSLVYEPGATTCFVCGDDLAVVCPKCAVNRSAVIETCAGCGLVLRIEPRARALVAAGPRPGGAAVA
jgi:hypothetical protein